MVLFSVISRRPLKRAQIAEKLIRWIRSNNRRFHPPKICPSSPHSNPSVNFVDSTRAPKNFQCDSALVYENFISAREGEALFEDISKRLRRRRFEKGHWDAVISNYKEIEIMVPSDVVDNTAAQHQASLQSRPLLSPESCRSIERVRNHLEQTHFGSDPSSVRWLPCHAIYLKKEGKLSAHVDSVRYSGRIVAGISLLSPSIMRLIPASPSEIADSMDGEEEEGEGTYEENHSVVGTTGDADENSEYIDLYLPPLSLYVLSGVSRYKYTHSLLPSGCSFSVQKDPKDYSKDGNDGNIRVDRDDRISVVFRDSKRVS